MSSIHDVTRVPSLPALGGHSIGTVLSLGVTKKRPPQHRDTLMAATNDLRDTRPLPS